ncbi:dodecin [Thalassoroseus pseudoceratinae]|uniref:dodecin n=1 Tax=Thalassoroseus pseudoceratinae TaxID=2713176 RepID=UPI001421F90E|nr:dodecin [Thalassoroseus pseudoceratinae]
MDAHIYKKIELTGTSPNSVEEAVQNAITKAGESVREMKWFELSELRGDISDNKVAHWQATIKVGFRLDG